MRTEYDEQLENLHSEMAAMGGLCENAIAMSAKALCDRDFELAGRVSELSAKINRKERDLERMCIKLLLQQQPVATDLRTVSSALKMITDMERIGDNSGDIAEIVLCAEIPEDFELETIREMAQGTIRMVTDSIEAFVKNDAQLARSVILYDDKIDTCFTKIKDALTLRIRSGASGADCALDILMIAKYLERMGDHAVIIAGWVIYSITGIKE